MLRAAAAPDDSVFRSVRQSGRELRPGALAFVLAFACASASGADTTLPEVYRVDSSHSYLGFRVKHLGFTTVRGRFTDWSGAVAYSASDVRLGSVTILVRTESVDTGNDSRDRDLRRDHYFSAEKHPLISFQSTRIEGGPDQFVAHGVLSIKGRSRPVAVPFASLGQVHALDESLNDFDRIGFAGSFTLLRSDFGVVYEGNILETSGAIGAEVEVEFEVSAIRRDYAATPWARFSSKQSAGEEVLALIESKGIEAGLDQFRAFESSQPDGHTTSSLEYAIAAERLVRGERGADALRLLDALIAARPDDLRLRSRIAETRLELGDVAEAEQAYLELLALDPMSGVAVERLRQLRRQTGTVTLPIDTASAPGEPPAAPQRPD